MAFSNTPYADAVAMGNVLADYADTGGVVVGLNFDWFGAPFELDGALDNRRLQPVRRLAPDQLRHQLPWHLQIRPTR